MGDLSEHFSAWEFRCKDGSEHPIDPKLLTMLELVRAHFGGKPVLVTSGYRSPEYNQRIGGATNSYHTKGMAADFAIHGVSPADIYAYCDRTFPTGGVGRYAAWVHLDCRPYRARW